MALDDCPATETLLAAAVMSSTLAAPAHAAEGATATCIECHGAAAGEPGLSGRDRLPRPAGLQAAMAEVLSPMTDEDLAALAHYMANAGGQAPQ